MRTVSSVAVFVSAVFFPWWISALYMLVGSFFFRNFYEAVLAGFLIDLIYGPSYPAGAGFVLGGIAHSGVLLGLLAFSLGMIFQSYARVGN